MDIIDVQKNYEEDYVQVQFYGDVNKQMAIKASNRNYPGYNKIKEIIPSFMAKPGQGYDQVGSVILIKRR